MDGEILRGNIHFIHVFVFDKIGGWTRLWPIAQIDLDNFTVTVWNISMPRFAFLLENFGMRSSRGCNWWTRRWRSWFGWFSCFKCETEWGWNIIILSWSWFSVSSSPGNEDMSWDFTLNFTTKLFVFISKYQAMEQSTAHPSKTYDLKCDTTVLSKTVILKQHLRVCS